MNVFQEKDHSGLMNPQEARDSMGASNTVPRDASDDETLLSSHALQEATLENDVWDELVSQRLEGSADNDQDGLMSQRIVDEVCPLSPRNRHGTLVFIQPTQTTQQQGQPTHQQIAQPQQQVQHVGRSFFEDVSQKLDSSYDIQEYTAPTNDRANDDFRDRERENEEEEEVDLKEKDGESFRRLEAQRSSSDLDAGTQEVGERAEQVYSQLLDFDDLGTGDLGCSQVYEERETSQLMGETRDSHVAYLDEDGHFPERKRFVHSQIIDFSEESQNTPFTEPVLLKADSSVLQGSVTGELVSQGVEEPMIKDHNEATLVGLREDDYDMDELVSQRIYSCIAADLVSQRIQEDAEMKGQEEQEEQGAQRLEEHKESDEAVTPAIEDPELVSQRIQGEDFSVSQRIEAEDTEHADTNIREHADELELVSQKIVASPETEEVEQMEHELVSQRIEQFDEAITCRDINAGLVSQSLELQEAFEQDDLFSHKVEEELVSQRIDQHELVIQKDEEKVLQDAKLVSQATQSQEALEQEDTFSQRIEEGLVSQRIEDAEEPMPQKIQDSPHDRSHQTRTLEMQLELFTMAIYSSASCPPSPASPSARAQSLARGTQTTPVSPSSVRSAPSSQPTPFSLSPRALSHLPAQEHHSPTAPSDPSVFDPSLSWKNRTRKWPKKPASNDYSRVDADVSSDHPNASVAIAILVDTEANTASVSTTGANAVADASVGSEKNAADNEVVEKEHQKETDEDEDERIEETERVKRKGRGRGRKRANSEPPKSKKRTNPETTSQPTAKRRKRNSIEDTIGTSEAFSNNSLLAQRPQRNRGQKIGCWWIASAGSTSPVTGKVEPKARTPRSTRKRTIAEREEKEDAEKQEEPEKIEEVRTSTSRKGRAGRGRGRVTKELSEEKEEEEKHEEYKEPKDDDVGETIDDSAGPKTKRPGKTRTTGNKRGGRTTTRGRRPKSVLVDIENKENEQNKPTAKSAPKKKSPAKQKHVIKGISTKEEEEEEQIQPSKRPTEPGVSRKRNDSEVEVIQYNSELFDSGSESESDSDSDWMNLARSNTKRQLQEVEREVEEAIKERKKQANENKKRRKRKKATDEDEDDGWSREELTILNNAWLTTRIKSGDFWTNVSTLIPGKTPDECKGKWMQKFDRIAKKQEQKKAQKKKGTKKDQSPFRITNRNFGAAKNRSKIRAIVARAASKTAEEDDFLSLSKKRKRDDEGEAKSNESEDEDNDEEEDEEELSSPLKKLFDDTSRRPWTSEREEGSSSQSIEEIDIYSNPITSFSAKAPLESYDKYIARIGKTIRTGQQARGRMAGKKIKKDEDDVGKETIQRTKKRRLSAASQSILRNVTRQLETKKYRQKEREDDELNGEEFEFESEEEIVDLF